MTGERSIRMVEAARSLIGTRFRVRGRSAETGVDCLGLVLLAARRAGASVPTCTPYYCMTGDRLSERLRTGMIAGGFREVPPETARHGFVLQYLLRGTLPHLGVSTPIGLVSAHTGLGRVVEAPVPPEWLCLTGWMIAEER